MIDSELAFKYSQVLKQAANDSENNFYLIGEVLDIINTGKLYKAYASHVTTFDQFLADIGIKRGHAYHALSVWRKFGAYDLTNIQASRLIKLMPFTMDDSEKKEWLLKAKEFPSFAFYDELRIKKGQLPRDECLHTENVTKVFCADCGKILETHK